MPGHIEYSGSLFDKIDDLAFRSDTFSTGRVPFELESKNTFELLISETADPNTLQAAYRSQENSPEFSCHFTVGKILKGLSRYDQLYQNRHRMSRGLNIDHERNCAQDIFPESQKMGVMIAYLDRTEGSLLHIHKISSDFFNEANNPQLYSAYQRWNYAYENDLFVSFTYVSDCPACIDDFVQHSCVTIVDTLTGRNLDSPCVTIHKSR